MKADGRYLGGDDELSVVLRVDLATSGVVSGDLARDGHYLASVRTAPQVRVTATEGQWPAIWQGHEGATSIGTLSVAPVADDPDRLTVTMRTDTALPGVPALIDHVAVAARHSDELRDLGLEIETEQGVREPGPVEFQGASLGLPECLRAAGFAVSEAGRPTEIPRASQPWDYARIYDLLNDLMTRTAETSLAEPAWEQRLLLLSHCSNDGLGGVMFDLTDPLPRQGTAVFVDRIRELFPDHLEDRQILRTVIHELGHAFNLVHRFERTVGRSDSTSFMNYPSRYLLGGHTQQYWDDFTYTFDPDELEFLRHAPQPAVRPGGAAFHSVRYWMTGQGGYTPYYPEVPLPGLRLVLEPPAAGPAFAFGQPVLLGVRLENTGDTRYEFPGNPLDPKTGGVEIMIRRVTGARQEPAAGEVFTPMMHACLVGDESTQVALPPGEVLRDNLNLTYGSGGFSFAEPGTYELTPVLVLVQKLPDGDRRERLARGEPLRIQVGYPRSRAEDRDALVLLRPDAGAWLALGGCDRLDRAADDLWEVAERRRAADPADPVAAGIVRAAGINAGRSVLRLREGRFRERAGDPQRAAELLGGLDPAALLNFDPQTAAGTARLASQYAAQLE